MQMGIFGIEVLMEVGGKDLTFPESESGILNVGDLVDRTLNFLFRKKWFHLGSKLGISSKNDIKKGERKLIPNLK